LGSRYQNKVRESHKRQTEDIGEIHTSFWLKIEYRNMLRHKKSLCSASEPSIHLGEKFYFVTTATLLTIVIEENFILHKIRGENKNKS
jgi:hypothetical protein